MKEEEGKGGQGGKAREEKRKIRGRVITYLCSEAKIV